MDPNDLLMSPAFAIVPGNIWHGALYPDTSSAPSHPAAPTPPPSPRMTASELDAAVVDLASRFKGPRVTTADMNAQLSLAPPHSATLLKLATSDAAVRDSMRSAVTSDGMLHFNANDVTTQDLAELKAEVQRNRGQALTALRAAVRVQ